MMVMMMMIIIIIIITTTTTTTTTIIIIITSKTVGFCSPSIEQRSTTLQLQTKQEVVQPQPVPTQKGMFQGECLSLSPSPSLSVASPCSTYSIITRAEQSWP
jgi:hypothetical protein